MKSTCWYWTMFGFRFTWSVLTLFLAIICLLFLWSCILPFVHEWYCGLALTGSGEVHVVQTNKTIGCSQEMLPTCSKINPVELVLYSSRVFIGEILTAAGDPSLEVQPFSPELWPILYPITSIRDPKTQPACSRNVCQHSSSKCWMPMFIFHQNLGIYLAGTF